MAVIAALISGLMSSLCRQINPARLRCHTLETTTSIPWSKPSPHPPCPPRSRNPFLHDNSHRHPKHRLPRSQQPHAALHKRKHPCSSAP
ncbi:hypothetical protein K432DRAFT_379204 [Lepidopterella palustris CBS 459.81]|uniref:Secreted protein n=1 Tax=Lepidopterella palustris CBS 459.81 TaxID=1314670 RepID=A0A8E2JIY9_9PEZI|nr:hypothetical protein K432DRAFT_379204 [Lepidopterella palustris CBS 459.81]